MKQRNGSVRHMSYVWWRWVLWGKISDEIRHNVL